MGSKYVYNINPFRDYLIESLKYNFDISKNEMKLEIDASFRFILKNVLNDEKEAVHLDFEIIRENFVYRVVGKNPPSALWLSGIMVENVETLLDATEFTIEDRKYKYDKKRNKLTFTIKK